MVLKLARGPEDENTALWGVTVVYVRVVVG